MQGGIYLVSTILQVIWSYLDLFCLPVPFKHAFMCVCNDNFKHFMIWRWKWEHGEHPCPNSCYLGKLPRLKNWIALTFNWHLLMVFLPPPCHHHPATKKLWARIATDYNTWTLFTYRSASEWIVAVCHMGMGFVGCRTNGPSDKKY